LANKEVTKTGQQRFLQTQSGLAQEAGQVRKSKRCFILTCPARRHYLFIHHLSFGILEIFTHIHKPQFPEQPHKPLILRFLKIPFQRISRMIFAIQMRQYQQYRIDPRFIHHMVSAHIGPEWYLFFFYLTKDPYNIFTIHICEKKIFHIPVPGLYHFMIQRYIFSGKNSKKNENTKDLRWDDLQFTIYIASGILSQCIVRFMGYIVLFYAVRYGTLYISVFTT